MAKKALFIIISFLIIAATISGVNAIVTLSDTDIEQYAPSDYRGGISSHVGEICVACHSRFSKDQPYSDELPYNVSNNAVLHIFPCSKPACHKTPPTRFAPKGTSRWTLHLKICENCHPKWETPAKTVHNTHLNFSYLLINNSGVECGLCHAQPRGYNSSVVRVPAWPSGETEFTGTIFKPPWEGECSYCHFTIKGALRVHDVHEPVLLEGCPVCHSTHILNAKGMFNRIGFPYPFEEEKPLTVEEKLISTVTTNETIIMPEATLTPLRGEAVPVLAEFYLYFDGILEEFINIYSFLV